MPNLRAIPHLLNEAARLYNEYLNAKNRQDADEAKKAFQQTYLAVIKLSPVMFEETEGEGGQAERSGRDSAVTIVLPAATQKSFLN